MCQKYSRESTSFVLFLNGSVVQAFNMVILSSEDLKSLTASLGVKPLVVVAGRGPDVVVDRDGQSNKEDLRLDTAEGVEDGVVESSVEWVLGVARDRVSSNTSLSRGTDRTPPAHISLTVWWTSHF